MSTLPVETATEPITITSGNPLKQTELEQSLNSAMAACGFSEIPQIRDRFMIFDLSRSYWHDLGASLWLITLLHKLKIQGNRLQLIFPEPSDTSGENLWGYLNRWRFFNLLAFCVDVEPSNLLSPSQVPYIGTMFKYKYPLPLRVGGNETLVHNSKILEMKIFRFENEEEGASEPFDQLLARCTDNVVAGALSFTCGWGLTQATKFVKEVLREGILNSSIHGRGTFSIAAMRFDKKNMTLAIADNGTGIPETLRTAYRSPWIPAEIKEQEDSGLISYFADERYLIDSRWILLSVEKGTTSMPGRVGEGLYYLKSNVLAHGGELRIRSGKARVDFTVKGEEHMDALLSSPGTMIRAIIPIGG